MKAVIDYRSAIAMTWSLTVLSWVGYSHADTEAESIEQRAQRYSAIAAPLPRQLLWGDTHLHTRYSFDAGMILNTLGPEEAYRFARGETVVSSMGVPARLQRPLDFMAVSDHAESLGIAPAIAENDTRVLEDEYASQMHDLIEAGQPIEAYKLFARLRAQGSYVLHNQDMIGNMWQRITAAADRYYQPGQFTTFIGYEYTSAINMSNLHRVVLFRDGAELANKVLPFSMAESPDPEALWQWMGDYEQAVGGRVLAIPHNGNLSNGLMFSAERFNQEPYNSDVARTRARFEPLYEVTQIKGDGEAHPLLSPDDRFADFWTWDRGNFGSQPKTDAMLPGEYARSALKTGLQLEQQLGANPFKFGLIGSTDAHTSLSTADENNFFSKASPGEPGQIPDRYTVDIIQRYPKVPVDISVKSYESAAGGLMAVWSTANTREAIFDAMERREVYATTGPRMALRVFAGFDLPRDAHTQPDIAAVGYASGIPMGSDLPAPHEKGAAPKFLIVANRDPLGANLDRAQVVKGWLDAQGELHERIFDVAWAGARQLDEQGRLPAVSSTVDGASYNNTQGAAVLATTWEDPEFDPSLRAFWYVRVLEIPTPTWLAYDKAHFGDLIDLPADARLEHQERAYSSPIWYSPSD